MEPWKDKLDNIQTLVRELPMEGRDINSIVKEFNTSILQAAHETIPGETHRNYKPYWSSELEKF